MKKFTVPIAIFAVLLLSGGVFAFIKVASLPSLLLSFFSGTILLACSFYIYKEKIIALYLSAFSIFALHLFFLFRFFKTLKFMPAGLFVLLTTLLGTPLLSYLTRRIKEQVYRQ